MNDHTNQFIDKVIKENNIVLFMKGTAKSPKCGFSDVVCKILNLFAVEYIDIDVLSDENLRHEIKIYSNWPTIPQLYIKGEFIGGCDIVRELYQTGEFKKMLQEKKIIV